MQVRYGMVHGRFQPFHNGHLQYALEALTRCSHLIIGITNSDPSLIVEEAADSARHCPEANVFTFFERMQMIRAALTEVNVSPDRFSIVPLPIHHPDLWRFYCPDETVQFVRVLSPWGQEKARRFREHGWHVTELVAGEGKQVSGTEVRRRLQLGKDWEPLVPAGVVALLREIQAVDD
jgi:nicotinamide-nucleotide adenylyltransferase